MATLSHHPLAPERTYLAWQRKVKIQLEQLLAVPDPDIRTRGEIHKLQQRLAPPASRRRNAKR